MEEDERIKRLRQQNVTVTEIQDRQDARIYFVKIFLPTLGKTLASAVQIEDRHVSSPRVQALATRDGLTLDQTFEACAVDSLRIQLQQSGFAYTELKYAVVHEVRKITAKQAYDLVVEYARKEGD